MVEHWLIIIIIIVIFFAILFMDCGKDKHEGQR